MIPLKVVINNNKPILNFKCSISMKISRFSCRPYCSYWRFEKNICFFPTKIKAKQKLDNVFLTHIILNLNSKCFSCLSSPSGTGYLSRYWPYFFRPFRFHAPTHFLIIGLSNLLTLSIPDEGYFRNLSYALNHDCNLGKKLSIFYNENLRMGYTI